MRMSLGDARRNHGQCFLQGRSLNQNHHRDYENRPSGNLERFCFRLVASLAFFNKILVLDQVRASDPIVSRDLEAVF
jgi:hypothetical protein